MEMKAVSDCLNFIDRVILCGVENCNAIGNLELVRDYMIELYNDKYIEDMVIMSGLMSQINLIIEKYYDIDGDSDLKREDRILRIHILAWLEEKKTKPKEDIDNQE